MGQMIRALASRGLCCFLKGLVICLSLFVVFIFLLLCTKVDLIGFLERSFRGEFFLPVLNISVHHTPIVIVDEHNEGSYQLQRQMQKIHDSLDEWIFDRVSIDDAGNSYIWHLDSKSSQKFELLIMINAYLKF